MAFAEYSKYDGLGLAELVRKKKVSPGELVEEAISRVEAHNPKLNAVVYKLYDRARAAATSKLPEGPFKGVPFLIKDLHATLEGTPSSHGNRLWKNVPAALTTEIVKRWEASGAIVVGRTNTPEFGLLPYTEADVLGPALNPWDTTRSPGGSSGGSGAAVAQECEDELGCVTIAAGDPIRLASALVIAGPNETLGWMLHVSK